MCLADEGCWNHDSRKNCTRDIFVALILNAYKLHWKIGSFKLETKIALPNKKICIEARNILTTISQHNNSFLISTAC